MRDAAVEGGAGPELAHKPAGTVIDITVRSELATKSDLTAALAELKAELYRAMLIQTGVTIGAIVTLLKLLP
ncbi:MAG TPA: hypothetical protein VFY87_21395 [Geminicoccaceae bacterium]|nr:hypothetical protein [Geminicoccaceae bacterium]